MPLLLVITLLVGLNGCRSKFSDERDVDLEAGGEHYVFVDAPRSDQAVTVEFTSNQISVTVVACLKKHKDTALFAANRGIKPEIVLASKQQGTGGSLQFSMPAKEEFVLILAGADKRTNVRLKIEGK